MSTTNLEEAATVASEFISSLENLPAEEIQKEGSKYDTAIPSMVEAHYDEINKLCQEKELLAERIVQIVMRAKARLDCDLNRVLVLQGEGDLPVQAGYYPPVPKTSVTQVNDMLRNPPSIVELPSTPTPSGAPPMKKRRVAATASAGSIKLPSPAPAAVPASANLSAAAGQRSRLSQQVSLRNSPAARSSRRVTTPVPDANEDAEGEDDVEEDAMEEGGDQEDKELYCFCRKLSYGEMIGCDNPDCRYQWFHLPCVNLKPPLPDQWYCDECIEKFGLAPDPHSERRKSRKK
ncbi:hypothetical protein BDY19DRAFT_481012 [Irpex rosettiformis]|uniref:Uncharacterized protein n=1 Tax=Irpex rosettiformis TaxID=378272 RepID=A0ACB8UDU8_9APHY|nr:hypothetical protein BDY19DRAFT_481012 [Irpex rosettiformis]